MTFDEYVYGAHARLLRFATVLAGDPHLAEDLVQGALLSAFGHWTRIGSLDQPHAYVRRIVVNDYLSWRRKWRRQHSTADLEALLPALADHADATDAHIDLLRRLAQLPHTQRAVVVLRFYEQLSTAEIAGTLHCRESSVRSALARALARLRVDLATERPVPTEMT